MAIPNNPIDVPHVDAYSGVTHADDGDFQKLELERRVQEIFLRWLLIYFNGDPFTVRDPITDADVVHQFEHCDCDTEEIDLPDALERPLIHAVPSDFDRNELGIIDNLRWKNLGVTWNIYVRTSPGLKGSTDALEGKHLCKRVTSELLSLLEGDEVQGLGDRGLYNVQILRGPVPIQNAHYYLRQIVISMAANYHVPYNVSQV